MSAANRKVIFKGGPLDGHFDLIAENLTAVNVPVRSHAWSLGGVAPLDHGFLSVSYADTGEREFGVEVWRIK